MKIAVCINHVPDTAAKIIIDDSKNTINDSEVAYILNPYDEIAIEEALRIKEKTDGEVVVISAGAERNKESIKKALAMGADSGVLLKIDNNLDSFGIAKALANEIKTHDAKLVFMGKQSVDFDSSIVGQLTAQFLEYNCITTVVDFALEENIINASREIEGGVEIVQTSLPCIITTQKGLNEPRYANLKGIMAAKKKTIEEKEISSEINSQTEIIDMSLPSEKSAGKIIGTDVSAIPELVRLLKEEAKVI